ncbi:MAG: LLM class F420-dependent oxidoreductase [Candidatus Binatia bacterium]|nr:LLM class F420-dependent oxidoreductase [Candidatus Binatia bacterium]
MRFGLTSPVVTLTPRGHAPWEDAAGPEELRQVAEAADRLGYHHLTCSEHVGIPTDVGPARGSRYYDPLATFGYLAAFTRRIRLATHVLVLPYHHPLEVAKRYGTLDRISNGRLILGVGVGSLEEEFRLLGAEFDARGPLFEDGLRALRAAMGGPTPSYQGTHFSFDGFTIDPCAVQDKVPLWIGGRSERSLRRALEFADGWDPFGLSLDALRDLLARARAKPAWIAREECGEPLDLIFQPERSLDLATPDGLERGREICRGYAEIGATVLSLRFRSASVEQFIEQLEIGAAELFPEFSV